MFKVGDKVRATCRVYGDASHEEGSVGEVTYVEEEGDFAVTYHLLDETCKALGWELGSMDEVNSSFDDGEFELVEDE
jgi:hypothetical protein